MSFRICVMIGLVCVGTEAWAQKKGDDLTLPPLATELSAKAANQKHMSDEEMAELKANLKKEIMLELKGPVKEWKQEAQPRLNFLELNGYLRMRVDAMSRCDLGTRLFPSGSNTLDIGTSGCPSPLSYYDDSVDLSSGPGVRPSWLFSTNMRLRVDPTLNVSEDIRIKGTVDVFDNLVLGSTPNYMTGMGAANATYPYSFLSMSQNAPILSLNNPYGAINVKRLWGEITTPIGELRFGRMPMHFGLGLLYNGGNQITNDYGDNIDGITFATRVFGHYLIPGASISYTGATGRGGGFGKAGDNNARYSPAEMGQHYDLDPSDNVYSFFLTFAKKDKDADAKALLEQGQTVFNYGVLGSYRFQVNDSTYTKLTDTSVLPAAPNPILEKKLIPRNANVGFLSLWSDIRWDKLRIEAEFAGVLGQIGNVSDLGGGTDPLWIIQGGAAIKTRYGFLNDRLEVGVDAGWASGDPASGFGARPGNNKNPAAGAADGQQFSPGDNYLTNFRFNPDYRIDMLLFREILGTVTDAFYLKPHVGYFFTDELGVRADVIASFSNFASSTPGNSNMLGIEIDGQVFYRSEDGFHFMLQYGLLVPFSGLGHTRAQITNDDLFNKYGSASTASALQLFAGISF
jgi:uncharacterized protein (TIGR04551 family)